MKNLIILFSIPFITILISVLLICVVCVSPIILFGYIWSTLKRKERRESEFYPSEKLDLKTMIHNYKKTKEGRL